MLNCRMYVFSLYIKSYAYKLHFCNAIALNFNYRNIEFPYCVLIDFLDIDSQDLIIVRTYYWQGLYTIDLQN